MTDIDAVIIGAGPAGISCALELVEHKFTCVLLEAKGEAGGQLDEIENPIRSYPSGPFEWGDRLCPKRIVEILHGLYDTFGDQRYRPSPWLLRRANLSLPLSTPDRAD